MRRTLLRTISTTSVRTAAPVTVLVAALVAALAYGVVQLNALHRESDERDTRTQVLKAARTEVLALTNIGAATTQAQIQALLDGMTPHLKAGFAPQVGAFLDAMVKSKVESSGRVIAIGVTAIGGGRASAVVAAAARVSNSQTAPAEDRNYRLGLTLVETRGRWLVDSMEFVQ